MSKFFVTSNKFAALIANPDQKPEEFTSTNDDMKYTSFQVFQSKLLEIDHKGQFVDIFNVLMKNIKNVLLPEAVPVEDYFIYFLTSAAENKIFERKNVMQTDVGFPFIYLRKDLQAKLLETTASQEELDNFLMKTMTALMKLFTSPNESQKDFGACISYRICIQLICRKAPTVFTKFLSNYINDFETDSGAHNPRYLNFVTWLFCQLGQSLANNETILMLILSYYERMLANQAQKPRYSENQVINKLYNINIVFDFYRFIKPNQKSESQKCLQQILASQLLTIEHLRPYITVNELAITMLAKVIDEINTVAAESDKKQLFKTIVITAHELDYQLTQPIINLMIGCDQKIVSTDKMIIEIMQKKQFDGYRAQVQQLDDSLNAKKMADSQVKSDLKQPDRRQNEQLMAVNTAKKDQVAQNNDDEKIQAVEIAKLQAINARLQAQFSQSQIDCNTNANELAAIQARNTQLTANIADLQVTFKKTKDDLSVSNQLVADLKELVKTIKNEFASKINEKQNEVEHLISTLSDQKSKTEFEADQHRQALKQLEFDNIQLNQKVLQLSQDGQKYVQQLQKHIDQLNAQLQQQVQTGSNEQLITAQQRIQQFEFEAMKQQQANAKQEVEMMKSQLQQNNEMMKLNNEIHRLQNELARNQADLAKAKSNAQTGNVCKKCGAQFIDAEDFAEHEASCKRIKCPLCDMKTFKQQDQFFEHIESHKKRDNVVSE